MTTKYENRVCFTARRVKGAWMVACPKDYPDMAALLADAIVQAEQECVTCVQCLGPIDGDMGALVLALPSRPWGDVAHTKTVAFCVGCSAASSDHLFASFKARMWGAEGDLRGRVMTEGRA
jgi:hypothetical protein